MNILVLMVDQLNTDYIGFSGKKLVDTPNLNWVAQTSFENAVTTNPVCTPARCSLLTGKYPYQVGMMTMSGALNTDYPTYAKVLQEHNYFTAAVGKMHLLQGWHWDVPVGKGHDLVALNDRLKDYGFDYVWEATGKGLAEKNYCDYCKYLEDKGLLENYRNEVGRRREIGHPEYPTVSEDFGISEDNHVEKVITDQVIDLIKNRNAEKQFCIFCSFLSPHPIIDPPKRLLEEEPLLEETFKIKEGQEPFDETMKQRWRENRRGYRALVRFIDEQVGRIKDVLEKEGLIDDTAIIFTSDHGDVLGDFKIDGKNLPWRESAGIPIAIRHPDYVDTEPKRLKSPTSLIDVTATILDFAGLDAGKELSIFWPAWNHVVDARSLMPIVRRETDKVREFTFTENDAWEMIQTERLKYVRYRVWQLDYKKPVELLFDIEKDPEEYYNVASDGNYREALQWCRDRREHILSITPCGQVGWAPSGDMRYNYIKEYNPLGYE